MRLYEYQSKELLRSYGIRVPASRFIGREEALAEEFTVEAGEIPSDRVVLKVQVLEGGRGRRGGVVVVPRGEVQKELKRLLKKWPAARGVLLEEFIPHQDEYYLSLLLDRERRGITLLASISGGVDVEASGEALPLEIDPFTGPMEHHRRLLKKYFRKDVGDLPKRLFKLFVERDLTLVEINPLVIHGGSTVALDAKITYDPSALHRSRLPENPQQYTPLELEGRRAGLSVVEMDGRCAVMANGAGLTMATIDYLEALGISPRLFLDLSGTDDPERVREAFHIAVKTSPEAILINIFSGMTKADTVAAGILKGMEETEVKVPIIVRLHGTNYEVGRKMLLKGGVHIYETLPEAVEHLRGVLEGVGR